MNRIGDIGLLTAILIIYTTFHTFDIETLFIKGTATAANWANVGDFLPYVAFAGVFLAVAAKSAQFPLHTWLPDAMEGPTSVSSLIHAATMVAAGVFLLGRVYPMFNETQLTILAVIGCFTAFMAATIALTQNDLKRILAYSTISQLGYMVMAMGIGAYASSLFHLVTHAFFKCLLFLVAGIVIHQMAHIKDDNNLDIDVQDIQNMGGLRKKLPLTFIAAIIGGVALIGLPLTSGYLSKDGILIQTFKWSENKNLLFNLVPILAVFTTWLTAFYVTRLIVKVFFGDLRILENKPDLKIHVSDGGWQYKLPLVLLAICCFFPTYSLNPVAYEHSWLFKGLSFPDAAAQASLYNVLVPAAVSIIGFAVIFYTCKIYTRPGKSIFQQTGFLFNLSFNAWYFDSIYNKIIIRPILILGRGVFWFDRTIIDGFIKLLGKTTMALAKLSVWTDKYIVDGFLNLLAAIVQSIGNFARRFQGGKVQYYLYSMLAVVVALLILKTVF